MEKFQIFTDSYEKVERDLTLIIHRNNALIIGIVSAYLGRSSSLHFFCGLSEKKISLKYGSKNDHFLVEIFNFDRVILERGKSCAAKNWVDNNQSLVVSRAPFTALELSAVFWISLSNSFLPAQKYSGAITKDPCVFEKSCQIIEQNT